MTRGVVGDKGVVVAPGGARGALYARMGLALTEKEHARAPKELTPVARDAVARATLCCTHGTDLL
jgi:hypothetical protein